MAKQSLRVLSAALVAAVVVGVSTAQVQKQLASQSDDPLLGMRFSDGPFGEFWRDLTLGLIKDLEMKDSTEAALLNLGNLDESDESDKNAGISSSVCSIVLLRPGDSESISKVCKHCADDFVTRFRRVVTPTVKSPIAIFTTAYVENGLPRQAQTLYRLDEKGQWVEWPKTQKKKDNGIKFNYFEMDKNGKWVEWGSATKQDSGAKPRGALGCDGKSEMIRTAGDQAAFQGGKNTKSDSVFRPASDRTAASRCLQA